MDGDSYQPCLHVFMQNFDRVHLFRPIITIENDFITNKFHIIILWINMCLQMLDVYETVSMYVSILSNLYLYDQQEDISRI